MNQSHTSDTGKTDPTDDQGNASQNGERKQLADGERSEVVARLRERFLFGG
jgi:hypothetical protein